MTHVVKGFSTSEVFSKARLGSVIKIQYYSPRYNFKSIYYKSINEIIIYNK